MSSRVPETIITQLRSSLEGSNVDALVGVGRRCIKFAEKFVGGNEWEHCIASDYNESEGHGCRGLVTESIKGPTSCTPGNGCISLVCQEQHLQWYSAGSQNCVGEYLGASTDINLVDSCFVITMKYKILKINRPGQGKRRSKRGTWWRGEAWLWWQLKEGNSLHKFHWRAPDTCHKKVKKKKKVLSIS